MKVIEAYCTLCQNCGMENHIIKQAINGRDRSQVC